jgi:hypothetical protein
MTTRHTFRFLAIAAGVVAMTACGGSDDAADTEADTEADTAPTDIATTDATGPEPDAEPDAEPETEPEPEPQSGNDDEPAAETTSGGDTNATLTLASGEVYEFGVLCTLETQMAAGSEILFTATSVRGDLFIDITQFGQVGPVTGFATVTVFDGETFESIWGASSVYEGFGGGLSLSLDGSTINGSGTFYAADDPIEAPDGVEGDVVANC